jgi:hypothetical protein
MILLADRVRAKNLNFAKRTQAKNAELAQIETVTKTSCHFGTENKIEM